MAVAEIITVERRRRWKLAEKVQLVSEALEPGASVSEVARRHGLHASQLFAWKKLARDGGLKDEAEVVSSADGMFTPVVVRSEPVMIESAVAPTAEPTGSAEERSALSPSRGGRMEIALKRGQRITVFADVDGAALARVFEVLDRR